MSGAPRTGDDFRRTRLVMGAATALLAAVHLHLVWSRHLVNDDYQNLYTAWLQSRDMLPGRDFAAYSPQMLAELLVPFFRFFPDSMAPLFLGRLLVAALLICALWLLHRLSRELMGPVAAVLVVPLVLACRAIVYRGLDLRPDPLLVVLWLAALWTMRKPMPGRPRRALALGAALVAMAMVRLKSGLIMPLVVVVLLADLRTLRGDTGSKVRAVLSTAGWMMLGGLGALAGLALLLGSRERIGLFVHNSVAIFDTARAMMHHPESSARASVMRQSLRQDLALWVLIGVGLVLRLLRARRFDARANLLTAGAVGIALLWVLVNPAFYAYNLLMLMFLAIPLAAFAIQEGTAAVSRRLGPGRGASAAALAVLLVIGWSSRVLYRAATTRGIAHQLALQRFIDSSIRPDESVFALEGLGLHRPSIRHWRLPAVYMQVYRAGAFSLLDELRARPPALVVRSYRVPSWLREGEERAFITSRYVPLTRRVYIPGCIVSPFIGPRPCELTPGGRYDLLAWPPSGECIIDGRAFEAGTTVRLTAGQHLVTARSTAVCALRRHHARSKIELIRNPDDLPYLPASGLDL